MAEYIKLGQLEVYQIYQVAGSDSWKIYQAMDWQTKKIMGGSVY